MPKTYGRAGYGAITPSTLTATRRSLLTVRVGLCTDSIGGSPMGHSPKTHFLCCTTMTGPPVAHLLTSTRGPRQIIRQTRMGRRPPPPPCWLPASSPLERGRWKGPGWDIRLRQWREQWQELDHELGLRVLKIGCQYQPSA